MPEMDGITFIKKVRSSNAIFSNIPIIAITASTDAQFKTDSIQAGANAFFTKPFTEQNITNALAYVLKK
jgi:chemotaxis family two-component system sensor histidine kinase/response regulator PixL